MLFIIDHHGVLNDTQCVYSKIQKINSKLYTKFQYRATQHFSYEGGEGCVGKKNPYVFTIIHFISQIGTCIALFVALTSKTSIELF